MDLKPNIFALHYFLWFAALTSIYGYVSVYANHYANASASQYGMLNMILPFATILAKLFFCSLADRRRAHREFFIFFLATALVGYGSFGVLPFLVTVPTKESGLNISTWVLICIMTSVATISMSVISCLSDAFAVNSALKNNSTYGFIRLWGTLGWAASSALISFINSTPSLPLLVPGLIMTAVLMAADVLSVVLWPSKQDFELDRTTSDTCSDEGFSGDADTAKRASEIHDQQQLNLETGQRTYGTSMSTNATLDNIRKVSAIKIQWALFKQVASRRKSLYRHTILFTISGALTGLQWSYFFQYLNEIFKSEFTFISGLSMIGQSLCGELPFFILSRHFIQTLGRSHTLSLSFFAIGVRYLLYRYFLPNYSMYFVLMTESLTGPSFGLFYVVMTEVGLDYSNCDDSVRSVLNSGVVDNNPEQIKKLRQALRATMQSLMSACYEGFGVGIGSIVGGLTIDHYGFNSLWLWAAIVALVVGMANLTLDLVDQCTSKVNKCTQVYSSAEEAAMCSDKL